ncbi:MAG: NADPH-dependent F420 reductase [Candidatus Eisenbacteria bacterium]|nr:NAD(P)-binding domain-containing protein [Candidatus Eisenbacteria bacterium]
MRIGILGTGEVGKTIAKGLAGRGHEVRIGSRDVRKLDDWLPEAGPRVQAASFADAASFAEVAILATLWSGTENALRLAGHENLAGKVVIDTTNPLVFHSDGPPTLALGFDDSAGEQVQRWLPASRVVKCFNITGNRNMVDPTFPDGQPDMWICGNDSAAKETVSGICRELGWPPVVDCGGIEGARLLEPLAMLWIDYGIRHGSWTHAFKLLRK